MIIRIVDPGAPGSSGRDMQSYQLCDIRPKEWLIQIMIPTPYAKAPVSVEYGFCDLQSAVQIVRFAF